MRYTTLARSWWFQLVTGILPVDSTIVISYVVIANPVILLVDHSSVRAVFGLPLLLFLPGYAILSVLFPGRSSPRSSQDSVQFSSLSRSIDSVERVALSFGMSLALMPLIALVLWMMNDRGFDTTVLLGVLTAVIVSGMVYGTHLRLQLPRWQRYRVPIGRWADDLRAGLFSGEAPETVLNLALAVSIVLAAGSLGYAIVVPNQSASYTDVSLLTRDAFGNPSAANYSTEIEAGSEIEMTLAIENHEGRSVQYTAVVEIQRIKNNSQSQRQDQNTNTKVLTRLRTTVPAGETNSVTHTITPTMTGKNIQLRYLIYKDETPENTTTTNAYRNLFLWIDISNEQDTNNVSKMNKEHIE